MKDWIRISLIFRSFERDRTDFTIPGNLYGYYYFIDEEENVHHYFLTLWVQTASQN